jgi:DivIVA domain-containing protein
VSELSTKQQRLLDEIHNVRFKPTRIREGYEMGTVDGLLGRAASAVSHGESLAAFLDVTLPTVSWREGYDISEVDAFLTRLRGGG